MIFERSTKGFFDEMIRLGDQVVVHVYGAKNEGHRRRDAWRHTQCSFVMEIGQLPIGNDRSNVFSGIVEDQFQIIVRFLQLILQGTVDGICLDLRKANVERLEETETRADLTEAFQRVSLTLEFMVKVEWISKIHRVNSLRFSAFLARNSSVRI